MERDVITAQFVAGLHGLGLLRSWPFLDAADAEARLVSLERAASARAAESLDVLDTGPGYAAWSSTYDDRVNPLLVAEQPAISELLDGIPAGRALDAACGTGRITRLLVERGHDVTGVDASEEMLDRARLTAPEAAYQVASMLRLPFPGATFDLVCCSLALTHVTALQPVISEFARVLRDGGHLLLSDVHPVAVATGAHAFFRRPDGSHCVVRNQLHWHGAYVEAFVMADMQVRRCLEPRFSEEIERGPPARGLAPWRSARDVMRRPSYPFRSRVA